MEQGDMLSDGEFAAVVAAAAYAVNIVEQKELAHEEPTHEEPIHKKQAQKRRKSVDFSETSQPKTRRKNQESRIKLSSFKGSFKRLLTGQEREEERKRKANNKIFMDSTPDETFHGESEIEQEQPKNTKANDKIYIENTPDKTFHGKSEIEEEIYHEESSANDKIAEGATNIPPSVEKTPTLTDNKYTNDTSSDHIRGESEDWMTTKFPTSSYDNVGPDFYKPNEANADIADTWEREQLIKINNRYDKMMSMIIEWENEKKEKARKRMEKKQNEPASMRAKAVQKYENEIAKIEKVSGDAKALADEKRRNNETKAYEKAAKIRSTGELPRSRCCC